jgi:hypothetical protein
MRYIITILLMSLLCFVSSCGSGGNPTVAADDEDTALALVADPAGESQLGPASAEGDDAAGMPTAKKLQVVMNCRIVQAAAEAFAADNNGLYPADVSCSVSLLGKTLIDYLPGGERLVNPYHGQATEPVDGAAANQGETGYIGCYCPGTPKGYCITGVANDAGRTIMIIARECDGETVEVVGRDAQ